jgi:sugar phosphate isomerase/epimerase
VTGIPIALQMYSLREETSRDFIGTLEKVAAIGYNGVEFAGYGDMPVSELKRVIDSLGLKAASSHIPIPSLMKNLDQVIHDQLVLGSKYIVCPYVPEEERTEGDYLKLINLLNKSGEKCLKEGITLCYHNHDFELSRLSDGRSALQTILEETNPEWVKIEFDIYWLTFAGENPVDWLRRYSERAPIVHVKDMTVDGEKFFAELGTGGVDIESVLKLGEKGNIDWWIVEQDECKIPPIESVNKSFKYLSGKL